MSKIRLKGRIRRNFRSAEKVPDYYFLPNPTSVRTDYPKVPYYSVMIRGDNLYWDVTWEGDELCMKVLEKANEQLKKCTNMHRIYNKLKKHGGDDEGIRSLIKMSRKEIMHWTSVIINIESQIINSD